MVDPSTPHSSRILIADTDSSVLEALPQRLHENIPNCGVDLCSSHNAAIRKLLTSPYQLIISGAHLTEMNDFFLLERLRVVHPHTPLVVTAAAADKVAATEALARGAFDIITKPIHPPQVRACLRLVQAYQRYRNLLVIEERARERYETYLTSLLANEMHAPAYKQHLTLLQQTLAVYREGLKQIERSMRLLGDRSETIQAQAHAQAIERLNVLWK